MQSYAQQDANSLRFRRNSHSTSPREGVIDSLNCTSRTGDYSTRPPNCQNYLCHFFVRLLVPGEGAGDVIQNLTERQSAGEAES